MRETPAVVPAVCYVRADFDLVPAEPLLGGKLKCWIKLELVRISCPGIEEISAPVLRIDQHVRRSFTVGITVKQRVTHREPKQRSRMKAVNVRDSGRNA